MGILYTLHNHRRNKKRQPSIANYLHPDNERPSHILVGLFMVCIGSGRCCVWHAKHQQSSGTRGRSRGKCALVSCNRYTNISLVSIVGAYRDRGSRCCTLQFREDEPYEIKIYTVSNFTGAIRVGGSVL